MHVGGVIGREVGDASISLWLNHCTGNPGKEVGWMMANSLSTPMAGVSLGREDTALVALAALDANEEASSNVVSVDEMGAPHAARDNVNERSTAVRRGERIERNRVKGSVRCLSAVMQNATEERQHFIAIDFAA